MRHVIEQFNQATRWLHSIFSLSTSLLNDNDRGKQFIVSTLFFLLKSLFADLLAMNRVEIMWSRVFIMMWYLSQRWQITSGFFNLIPINFCSRISIEHFRNVSVTHLFFSEKWQNVSHGVIFIHLPALKIYWFEVMCTNNKLQSKTIKIEKSKNHKCQRKLSIFFLFSFDDVVAVIVIVVAIVLLHAKKMKWHTLTFCGWILLCKVVIVDGDGLRM